MQRRLQGKYTRKNAAFIFLPTFVQYRQNQHMQETFYADFYWFFLKWKSSLYGLIFKNLASFIWLQLQKTVRNFRIRFYFKKVLQFINIFLSLQELFAIFLHINSDLHKYICIRYNFKLFISNSLHYFIHCISYDIRNILNKNSFLLHAFQVHFNAIIS